MSRRDPRFKPLQWRLYPSGVWWQAPGINGSYCIAKTHGQDGKDMGTYSIVHGLKEINEGQYFYLADAQTLCQLDHEARIKAWMAE